MRLHVDEVSVHGAPMTICTNSTYVLRMVLNGILIGPLTMSGHFEVTSAVHTMCAYDRTSKVLHCHAPLKELKSQTTRPALFSSRAPRSQPESRCQSRRCAKVVRRAVTSLTLTRDFENCLRQQQLLVSSVVSMNELKVREIIKHTDRMPACFLVYFLP